MLRALRRLLREEWGQAMRRGVFVGLGMAIAAGGMAIAYNANTGGTTTTTTTTTVPSNDQANIWMAPNGGNTGTSTCTRSATAITYAQAQAAYPTNDYICGSVTNSCTAALNAGGDTIRVVDGSYGDQRTGCVRAGWTSFYLSDGAVFSTAGPTNSGNQYIKYIGGTINVIQVCPSGGGFRGAANYEWFEANHFNNVGGSDPCWNHIIYFNGHDITVIGPGQFGPNTNWGGTGNPGVYFEGGTYNVLIQGVRFYGICALHPSPNDHIESVYILSSHDITLRGDSFDGGPSCPYGNDTSGTIFLTNNSGNPYNITIENNFISSDRNAADGPYFIWTQTPSVTVCSGFTIQYNSFNETQKSNNNGNVLALNCGSQTNVVIRGNIMPFKGCTGTTWDYNVVQNATNPGQCGGTGNVWVSGATGEVNNLGYTNPTGNPPDLHLTAGSPACKAGNPNSFPALDVDGEVRPLAAGNNENVDSGADERDC